MPRVQSQGPFVSLAVLCRRVEFQPDGTLDLVGIVDEQYLDSVFLDQTDRVKLSLNIVIALRAGDLRGDHAIALRGWYPDGTAGAMQSRLIWFTDANPAARWVIPLSMDIEQLGVHWFDVLFEQRILTRISYVTLRRPALGADQGVARDDTGDTAYFKKPNA